MQRRTRTVPNDLSALPEQSDIRRLAGMLAVEIENSGMRQNFNFSRRDLEWLTIQLRFTVRQYRNRAQATWREPDNMLRLRLTQLVPNHYRKLGDRLRNKSRTLSYDLSNPEMFKAAYDKLVEHLVRNNVPQVEGESSRLLATFDQVKFESQGVSEHPFALARHVRQVAFEFDPRAPTMFKQVIFRCVDNETQTFFAEVRLPFTSFDQDANGLGVLTNFFANQMRFTRPNERAGGITRAVVLKASFFLMEGKDPKTNERFYSYLSQSNFMENFELSKEKGSEQLDHFHDHDNDEFTSSSNWGILASR